MMLRVRGRVVFGASRKAAYLRLNVSRVLTSSLTSSGESTGAALATLSVLTTILSQKSPGCSGQNAREVTWMVRSWTMKREGLRQRSPHMASISAWISELRAQSWAVRWMKPICSAVVSSSRPLVLDISRLRSRGLM